MLGAFGGGDAGGGGRGACSWRCRAGDGELERGLYRGEED